MLFLLSFGRSMVRHVNAESLLHMMSSKPADSCSISFLQLCLRLLVKPGLLLCMCLTNTQNPRTVAIGEC